MQVEDGFCYSFSFTKKYLSLPCWKLSLQGSQLPLQTRLHNTKNQSLQLLPHHWLPCWTPPPQAPSSAWESLRQTFLLSPPTTSSESSAGCHFPRSWIAKPCHQNLGFRARTQPVIGILNSPDFLRRLDHNLMLHLDILLQLLLLRLQGLQPLGTLLKLLLHVLHST